MHPPGTYPEEPSPPAPSPSQPSSPCPSSPPSPAHRSSSSTTACKLTPQIYTVWPFRLFPRFCWHQNEGFVSLYAPYTKAQLLFWCQQHPGNNSNGRSVYFRITQPLTTQFYHQGTWAPYPCGRPLSPPASSSPLSVPASTISSGTTLNPFYLRQSPQVNKSSISY